MKITTLLAVLLPLAALPVASAKPHEPGASKLAVTFPGWEKYTDIKDYFSPTEKGEQSILDNLRRAMESNAGYLVPDGDHLTVTFSDIDLAGDFEPGRGAEWDDVRIVKDVYPPRFVFSYSLADPSGRVIKSGQENITDLNFTQTLAIDTTDNLHYDKAVLRDWMERKLHGL